MNPILNIALAVGAVVLILFAALAVVKDWSITREYRAVRRDVPQFCVDCGKPLVMYQMFHGFNAVTGVPANRTQQGCVNGTANSRSDEIRCYSQTHTLGWVKVEHEHGEGSLTCRSCLNDLIISGKMSVEDACLLLGESPAPFGRNLMSH